MTGLSLREQLLQAGLVSEKQVKQAEQSQKRQTFTDRKPVSYQHLTPPTDDLGQISGVP